MKISTFTSQKDNRPKILELTFEELEARLGDHRITDCDPCDSQCTKKAGPAWSPAVWPEGETRSKNTVSEVHAIVLDIDKISDDDYDKVAALVNATGYRGFVHSSHSHRPGSNCFRLIFELSRPVTKDELPYVREFVNSQLGSFSDPATVDASRIYYEPSVPEKYSPNVVAESLQGKPIDVDSIPKRAVAKPVVVRVAPTPQPEPELIVDMRTLRRELSQYARDKTRDPFNRELYRRGELAKNIVDGAPIAEVGERFYAMTQAAGLVAKLFPLEPIEALLELVRPSMLAMPVDPTSNKERDWMWEIEKRIKEFQKKAAEEYEGNRAIAAAAAGLSQSQIEPRRTATTRRTQPLGTIAVTDKFTEEEVQTFAKNAGVQSFDKHWIVQFGDIHWFWTGADYRKATPAEVQLATTTYLSRAPIQFTKTSEKTGRIMPVPISELRQQYGSLAVELVSKYGLKNSHFDGKTFFEAICPQLITEPVYSSDVAEWLHELDPSDGILPWIAGFSDLSKPAALLYINGPRGCGKTLLAHALTKLWSDAPASFSDVAGTNFNDALVNSPLVYADEEASAGPYRSLSAFLREETTNPTRPLRRKFMPTSTLDGCLRFMVTANNENALKIGSGGLTVDDIDAVAERVHYLKAGENASKWIKAFRARMPQDYIDNVWKNGGEIARHSLWLRENIPYVIKENRLIGTGGDPGYATRLLTSNNKKVVDICEWLVKTASEPKLTANKYLYVGEGEYFVHPMALFADSWEKHMGARRHAPSTADVGEMLRCISNGTVSVKNHKGERTTYHRVRASILVEWEKAHNVASIEMLEKNLAATNQIIAEWKATHGN